VADLSEIERMMADWERDASARAARYDRVKQQAERILITESVASGAVSVTVGHNGLPTDVRMTEAVKAMSPDEIAANVLRAIRKAYAKYPERLGEIALAAVGDDTTTGAATKAKGAPAAPREDGEATDLFRPLFEG